LHAPPHIRSPAFPKIPTFLRGTLFPRPSNIAPLHGVCVAPRFFLYFDMCFFISLKGGEARVHRGSLNSPSPPVLRNSQARRLTPAHLTLFLVFSKAKTISYRQNIPRYSVLQDKSCFPTRSPLNEVGQVFLTPPTTVYMRRISELNSLPPSQGLFVENRVFVPPS